MARSRTPKPMVRSRLGQHRLGLGMRLSTWRGRRCSTRGISRSDAGLDRMRFWRTRKRKRPRTGTRRPYWVLVGQRRAVGLAAVEQVALVALQDGAGDLGRPGHAPLGAPVDEGGQGGPEADHGAGRVVAHLDPVQVVHAGPVQAMGVGGVAGEGPGPVRPPPGHEAAPMTADSTTAGSTTTASSSSPPDVRSGPWPFPLAAIVAVTWPFMGSAAGATAPRPPPDRGPTRGRPRAVLPRPVGVVGGGGVQGGGVEEPDQEGGCRHGRRRPRPARRSSRPGRARCTTRYSSSTRRARWTLSWVSPQAQDSRSSRRLKRTSARSMWPSVGPLGHVAVEDLQQPPGLGGQLVEGAPQHLVGQAVGQGDIAPAWPRCRPAPRRPGWWCGSGAGAGGAGRWCG